MIFHCTDPECQWVEEGEAPSFECPLCGAGLAELDPGQMTGDNWCALGIYWVEREQADEARALAAFRKAAELGSGWGVSNLGWCMERGIGGEADPRQAVWLYAQAVELDYTPALCSLGVCYERGIGTPANPQRAVELYQQGAELGYVRAQRLLARCYGEGIGVEMSLSKGFLPAAIVAFVLGALATVAEPDL